MEREWRQVVVLFSLAMVAENVEMVDEGDGVRGRPPVFCHESRERREKIEGVRWSENGRKGEEDGREEASWTEKTKTNLCLQRPLVEFKGTLCSFVKEKLTAADGGDEAKTLTPTNC
ncbi:hypothetical protein HAX54_027049 [Datura stramonium]|uniref:Secreted protein n=1 Tax=Datura stramonium TaxID=4076 RepID=A0ABS8V526_DATST|nr:hypothetical protein [Datura stramonium]